MSKVYTFYNPRHQHFPFHQTLIEYILSNLTFNDKEKLPYCCKFFSNYYPYDRILYRLMIMENNRGYNEENYVECGTINQLRGFGKKIWVKNFLYIRCAKIVNSLTTAITRCTVKELQIHSYVSVKNFEFLTKAKTVQVLILGGCIDDQGKFLPIENVLECVPNAYKISVWFVNITSNTMEHLALLNRKQKIKSLNLFTIDTEINALMFYQFLKKNAAPQPYISVCFIDNERQSRFKTELNKIILENCETEDEAFLINPYY